MGNRATLATLTRAERPAAADLRRRDRASRLHAADAQEVVTRTLPRVAAILTASQFATLQKAMDAAVVNPAVQAEYDELMKRAVIAQSGRLVSRDPDLVEKANRVWERGMVASSAADQRVRIDVSQLLTPDALTPRSDNPDEAGYLERIGAALSAEPGVWLRIHQPWVNTPDDPHHWRPDPRVWEAWLSFGPDGDKFPTSDGSLGREAITGNSRIGAGYYTKVHRGPVEQALDVETKRLSDAQDAGRQEHLRWSALRAETSWFVTTTADLLGGADFPDFDIWDPPHQVLMQAWALRNQGLTKGAMTMLGASAIVTEAAAATLAEFAERTALGAQRAVGVLSALSKAGEVADTILGLLGVGRALKALRAGVRKVLKRQATKKLTAGELDEAATETLKQIRNVTEEELREVRHAPTPKGSIGGNRKGGHSSGNRGVGMGKFL